jgi:hypothetical protein
MRPAARQNSADASIAPQAPQTVPSSAAGLNTSAPSSVPSVSINAGQSNSAVSLTELIDPLSCLDVNEVSYVLPELSGGWQRNSDLADRRRVIVNIVKIIERIRPDAKVMTIR